MQLFIKLGSNCFIRTFDFCLLWNQISVVLLVLTLILFLYIITLGDSMKKTIKDYEYNGKKVILRCDLNVPIENGNILDDTRIKESLKTINYLIDNEAKIIILSHLGKVKTEEDKQKNTSKLNITRVLFQNFILVFLFTQ